MENPKPTDMGRFPSAISLQVVLSVAERRRSRRINRRKNPAHQSLADFNIDAIPTITPATSDNSPAALHGRRRAIVLPGDSGTCKSNLLIGVDVTACEQGRRVRYATTAQLVNQLVEAADERVLCRMVGHYKRLDLLCLGYAQIDPRGAELRFHIITERDERAFVATATNLPFRMGQSLAPLRLLCTLQKNLPMRNRVGPRDV